MSLRMAYAAMLQFVRTRRGLLQQDIAVRVAHSHISQLEAVKTSASLEVHQDLAAALSLNPVTFLALVQASYEHKSAREILQTALQELEELALLDELLPDKPKKLKSPQMEDSERKREAVLKLKNEGYKQVEVVKMLGMPKSTVGRFWYADENGANAGDGE